MRNPSMLILSIVFCMSFIIACGNSTTTTTPGQPSPQPPSTESPATHALEPSSTASVEGNRLKIFNDPFCTHVESLSFDYHSVKIAAFGFSDQPVGNGLP